jgi:2'-5' RNA ligase
VAEEIERAAAAIKAGAQVRGRWVKPAKHHMTVQFLGNHAGSPASVIARAGPAAMQVKVAPFEVALDRIETFAGQRQSPCVLRCTPDSDRFVRSLRSALGEALVTAGLANLLEERFTPHVTIGYIDRPLDEPVAIAPVAWQVRQFALVESHIGESRHEILGQWRLSP